MLDRNVFLFGAGISRDAGIPLLANFVECMLEIALRKKCFGRRLIEKDCNVFDEAVKVIDSLDRYHGRAAFNDRNIEDLLSILSLSLVGGGLKDKKKFSAFVKAIARTIDLRCRILPAKLDSARQEASDTLYGNFWRNVISQSLESPAGSAPVIVSLNYDLVLERSLIATLAGDTWSPMGNAFPFNSVRIQYHCETFKEQVFALEPTSFQSDNFRSSFQGYALKESDKTFGKCLTIEILKLHGSLNFPRKSSEEHPDIQTIQSDPTIMPPVFVKSAERNLEPVWARAMAALSRSINLIICGYSLPITDTYMQYFLRAALGPNRDLSKILVFDPVLREGGEASEAMRSRYSNVFSHQIQNRINFNPGQPSSGTFQALVQELSVRPAEILFM